MKRILAVLLIFVLVFCHFSIALTEDDLFEITNAVVSESSPDFWKISYTVKNRTGEAVYNTILHICFTDDD